MIKIVTVVGARPQIIKAAAISRVIKQDFSDDISEVIIHTGQHYDPNMSKVFFDELDLPKEDYNLESGSGTHAQQTADMLVKIEEILMKEQPNCVLLYGDTNSTLAASLAAAKIHIPILHVEGGVRSFNKYFPEEVNRLICDHLSTMIFVPTEAGMQNLLKEGFVTNEVPPYSFNRPSVLHSGDIMYDNSMYYAAKAEAQSKIIDSLNLRGTSFILLTIHRPSNVDSEPDLRSILSVIDQIAVRHNVRVVIPLHPRSIKAISQMKDRELYERISCNKLISIIPAVSFLEMILLEKNASVIITDSGGVQKEAYYFKKPCIILLEETPWVELVESGSAILTGSNPERIMEAFDFFRIHESELKFPQVYGNGAAAHYICNKIIEAFKI